MSNPNDGSTATFRDVLNLLLYGGAQARHSLTGQLGGDPELVGLLAHTVRSEGSLLLRARSLEALGLLVADAADAQRAEILRLLLCARCAPS